MLGGKETFLFPFRYKRWPLKLLIGGAIGLGFELLFLLGGFLLIRETSPQAAPIASAANFPAFGYAFLVFKGALEGNNEMPSWEGWLRFTRIGLLLSFLAFIMGFLPLLLILLGSDLWVRGGALLVTGAVMITLGILAGLLVSFFFPMGLAWYVKGGKLEVAFRPLLLWRGIEKNPGRYMTAYLFSLTSLLLSGLLASFSLVGVLLWPFLVFYLMLVWAHLLGQACASIFSPTSR